MNSVNRVSLRKLDCSIGKEEQFHGKRSLFRANDDTRYLATRAFVLFASVKKFALIFLSSFFFLLRFEIFW